MLNKYKWNYLPKFQKFRVQKDPENHLKKKKTNKLLETVCENTVKSREIKK